MSATDLYKILQLEKTAQIQDGSYRKNNIGFVLKLSNL